MLHPPARPSHNPARRGAWLDTPARFLRRPARTMRYPSIVAVFSLLALVMVAAPGVATEGRAWGDIHVQTMDGASYDFQASGEFVASRALAGDLAVQLRLESRGFSPNVSVATAVAVLVDTSAASVVLGREPLLFVDDRPAALPRDGVLELPDGGRIERSQQGYEIFWRDGSLLSIDVKKNHLNAFLRPAATRRGTLSGLFGNFNGIAADDLEATAASLGSASSSAVLQAGLTDIARMLLTDEDDERLVTQPESLFQYEPGQSTYSFRKPMPSREASVEALPANWRQRAQQACQDAGVTDTVLLESCIIDVGYTRDESFAQSAVAVQARDVTNWDADLEDRPHTR